MSILSLHDVSDLRALRAEVTFTHTYTRTAVSDGTEDAYGQAAQTAGTVTTGLPCLYRAEDRLRTDEGGQVTVSVPTLLVAHDSLLAVGDRVSNVQDAAGTVLVVGPLTVESVEPSAGLGYVLSKRAILRGSDVRG